MEKVINLSTIEGDEMDALYDGSLILTDSGEVCDVQQVLDAGFLIFI